ncbi:HET domain-containing protein [Aspergillus vadensis CBS 113365]|uniref:HET-domain-containing protein n=1 Tax=Aspergillus vadensis (strain CBS 113365 / IMI 142717 / IBT 24658) TaxID=1448311 RepID=A0A319BG20_ASPVC|nr:HET-domain-containing protein [Aspergillus vadensis CBS 113365]PYH71695.1 HET-domain-containing protein [Aspergillus vadensis CBS 113365]
MCPLSDNLCIACAKLDLGKLLAGETSEQEIGLLSQHRNSNCPFCKLIVTAVSSAGWNFAESKSTGKDGNGTRTFIQSRSPLSVKKYGHIHHPEPRLQLAVDRQPEGFQRGRPTVREIDRNTKRFIVAELESIPEEGDRRFLQRRSVGEFVEATLVAEWLRECDNHKHSIRMRNRTNGLFHDEGGFLLIDVIEEKLVRKTEPCAYSALSYIWGGVEPFLTTTKNIDKLCKAEKALSPSHLDSLGTLKVPRTVQDAMVFTRQLGIRYAWVDCLCILQDKEDEIARLIGRMDDIYDNAAVTLIAGSGYDSQTGLMGVTPRQGGLPIRKTAIVDGQCRKDAVMLNLAICPPSLCEEIRRSAWNTRCWTYQEQCLSQRCLYFTPHEVFFNCCEMQCREAYALQHRRGKEYSNLELRTGPPWWNRKLRKDLDPTPYRYMGELNTNRLDIWDYQTAVQDYTRKELKYEEDVFNAFQGIYNRFSVQEEQSLPIRQAQGIPARFLWQAMLWFPSHTAKKRVAQHGSPSWLPTYFASWSWASWIGSVEFVFAESLWLSRNLSQALLKKRPVYPAVPCWFYSDGPSRDHRINMSKIRWSCKAWKEAGQSPLSSLEFHKAKAFLEKRLGLDTNLLYRRSLSFPTDLRTQEGHLHFFCAYTSSYNIAAHCNGQAHQLKIGKAVGEFRYDSLKESEKVEELALLVAAESITSPPYTVSILLGLVTKDGISRRVGLGYVNHGLSSDPLEVHWEYKEFRLA